MWLHFYLKDPNLKKKQPRKLRWKKIFNMRYHLYRSTKLNLAQNSLPYYGISNWQKLLLSPSVYNSKKKLSLDTHNFWFFLYQQHYFSLILKTPTTMKTMNALEIVPRSLLLYMINSVKHIRWKKYFIMHSNEIIEILFLSLWLKNLKLFMDWMRKYFEKTTLKKHRKLFLLLNLLLGKFIWSYNLFLQLKGLRVVLRGKFGKAGSVRKTRKYIRRGKCSYTTKKIALINQTNLIRTLTGVFSIKFEVFF